MVIRQFQGLRGSSTQRGGFFLGAVVGLLIGLAVALGVAVYVNKVPIPFVDKVPQRTAEQDAAETEKNKNWDPNAPLYGKNPAKPKVDAAASAAAADAASAAAESASAAASAPSGKASAAAAARAAAKASAAAAAASAIMSGVDPSAKSSADAFMYYVQVGAYARGEDAEQQRAKLGMSGLVGRVTEREQAGKLVYRVRVGPFDSRDEADTVKEQAGSAGYPDAQLVRVQR